MTTAGLPWKIQRLGPRSGISFSGRLARNAAEADADEQPELNALLRLYLANRGVWEAISTAGPAMSVDATQDDVGTYLAAFDEFVTEVAAARLTCRRAARGPRGLAASGRAHVLQLAERLGILRHRTAAPRTRARRSCGRDAC